MICVIRSSRSFDGGIVTNTLRGLSASNSKSIRVANLRCSLTAIDRPGDHTGLGSHKALSINPDSARYGDCNLVAGSE
jgi:hypothetical protein